jgi:hypothetical protein
MTNVQWLKACIHFVHIFLFQILTEAKLRFVLKQKKALFFRKMLLSEWSRRGSNPRPNDEFSSFLHAYFLIGFRPRDGQEHPNPRLRCFNLINA